MPVASVPCQRASFKAKLMVCRGSVQRTGRAEGEHRARNPYPGRTHLWKES